MEQQQHLSLSSALNKVRLEFAMTGFAARRTKNEETTQTTRRKRFFTVVFLYQMTLIEH